MNKILSICITVLLCTGPAFAEAVDDGTGVNPGQHGTDKNKEAEEAKAKTKIIGQCFVLAGHGNLSTSPCNNLTLRLDSGDGKDLLNTRTNATGQFEFTVPPDGKYHISVASRFYEVKAPQDTIPAGARFNLVLQQK